MGGEGHLFAAQRQSNVGIGSYHMITERDGSLALLSRFGYGKLQIVNGLAVLHSAAGDLALSMSTFGEPGSAIYLSQPEPGPLVVPPSVEAKPSNVKATIEAEVNPEGQSTTVGLEYVDRESFETEGGFASPNTKTASAEGSLPADFDLHGASIQIGCTEPLTELAEGKCLEPETEYLFRLAAESSAGEDEAEGEFTTLAPLQFEALWSSRVGTDAAQINAQVNPLGIPSGAWFEYLPLSAWQASGFAGATRLPAAGQIDLGAGEEGVRASVALSGLYPGTPYRYRVTGDDPLIEPLTGPEGTFTTLAAEAPLGGCPNEATRGGLSAFLPDCRAYEMVSPLDKENGDIAPPEEPSDHVPAANDRSAAGGEAFTYSSFQAFAGAVSAPSASQYLARRGTGGWATEAISPRRGSPLLAPGLQLDTEFKSFSPDLCQAWLRTVAEPPLAAGAIARFPNLYRSWECGPAAGAYAALTTIEPTHRTSESAFPGEHYVSLELQGTAAAGDVAAYAVKESLAASGAPPQPSACTENLKTLEGCRMQLYVTAGGQTRFACVLPNGTASEAPCSAGTGRGRNRDHARSLALPRALGRRLAPLLDLLHGRRRPRPDLPAAEPDPAPERDLRRQMHRSGQGLHDRGLRASRSALGRLLGLLLDRRRRRLQGDPQRRHRPLRIRPRRRTDQPDRLPGQGRARRLRGRPLGLLRLRSGADRGKRGRQEPAGGAEQPLPGPRRDAGLRRGAGATAT